MNNRTQPSRLFAQTLGYSCLSPGTANYRSCVNEKGGGQPFLHELESPTDCRDHTPTRTDQFQILCNLQKRCEQLLTLPSAHGSADRCLLFPPTTSTILKNNPIIRSIQRPRTSRKRQNYFTCHSRGKFTRPIDGSPRELLETRSEDIILVVGERLRNACVAARLLACGLCGRQSEWEDEAVANRWFETWDEAGTWTPRTEKGRSVK